MSLADFVKWRDMVDLDITLTVFSVGFSKAKLANFAASAVYGNGLSS